MRSPEQAPALRIDGVTRSFGPVTAVDDVSLELAPGELLALVGPSGCGKSTLLRLVAGLHRAESGTISLAGRLVDDGHRSLAPERRQIGLVFQDHALFPHLTVGDNVGFGLDRRDDDRVGHVLAMVGLAGHRARYPHELSGGERQRVALARALAPAPTLMLLDEPFASLDPNLRAQIRRDVVAILREADTPAVFVTHDQAEALAVADRVAIMRAGRLEQVDTPAGVFHRPRNRFVAALMGEAAFLPVSRSDGRLRTPLADAVVPGDELGERDPDTVLAMLRPDDLVVGALDEPSREPSGAGNGSGRVVSAEFRGATWGYTIELPSGDRVLASSSHLDHHPVGADVAVSMTPGHVPVLVDRD